MKLNRFALIGAGVGFALGMPLFEVFLLTILAIDGEWFDAAVTIQYFSKSVNLITLLVILHVVTASIGALVGVIINRVQKRRRLRVVPGASNSGR